MLERLKKRHFVKGILFNVLQRELMSPVKKKKKIDVLSFEDIENYF